MQIIVDANPLISILIKPGKPIDLLFIEELDFVAPELLFQEIENNIDLKCPLWSNEKRLKEQNEIMVYATHELLRLFNVD